VANSVEVKRVQKKKSRKKVKREVGNYCWLLAANYLDRYDSQIHHVMLLMILYTIIIDLKGNTLLQNEKIPCSWLRYSKMNMYHGGVSWNGTDIRQKQRKPLNEIQLDRNQSVVLRINR
jgi:hypothetical protein